MGKINYLTKTLCAIQANLFENFSKYSNCSPYVFIRRFMNSELATRFDNYYILGESSSNKTFMNELKEEYGDSNFGDPKSVHPEVLYWVGYIYRYWSIKYEIPSYQLYKYVQPRVLIERYYIFHSMDVDYAIERIIEEENITFPKRKTAIDLINELAEYIESQELKKTR